MKLDLRIGFYIKEIICPRDVIWFGVSYRNCDYRANISNHLELIFDDIVVKEEVYSLSDGGEIVLYFYSSNDKGFNCILEKNKGLRILEFFCEDFEIIVTI